MREYPPYKVHYGVLEGDDIPDTKGYPYNAAHGRQMVALQMGAHIRNPVCMVYSDKGLVCIDRPSRMWMAKTAGVGLPVFISDFIGKYEHWPQIETASEALMYIEDVPMKPPFFHCLGFIYRAP